MVRFHKSNIYSNATDIVKLSNSVLFIPEYQLMIAGSYKHFKGFDDSKYIIVRIFDSIQKFTIIKNEKKLIRIHRQPFINYCKNNRL